MNARAATLGLALMTGAVWAQQGDQELPRFRAGANLVRVDAYFTRDGAPVTDLSVNDVEVFEDDRPQTIEGLELVGSRGRTNTTLASEPTTVQQMREAAADAARLFTLFFDTANTSLTGSVNARAPVVTLLDKVIGADDMVGMMTPDISPTNITYSRRTTSIERFVRDAWNWGQRERATSSDPRDDEIRNCYVEHPDIAEEMIERRHEQKTLDAIDNLVTYLDGLRPERKFVVVFTDGWALYQRNERLARALDGGVPGPDPVGVGPGGRLRAGPPPQEGRSTTYESCERERVMLAYIDHEITLREIAQRANRGNVSFYPVDARGLVVFDQSISVPARAQLTPRQDAARLTARHDSLRTLAIQTDGAAVLNTNTTAQELQKLLADVGAYYLISYYSSNPRLDGRFRRITVRVKRDDVNVRARPGYLAPTEAEARAAGAVLPPTGTLGRRSSVGDVVVASSPPSPPAAVARALDAIAPGRGTLPVRVQAVGGRGFVRAIVELDAATAKQPEWEAGGELRLVIEPERGRNGGQQVMTAPIDAGQRSLELTGPDTPLDPGRYTVRAEVKATGSRVPLQVTTFVTVTGPNTDVGTGAVALRRGPSTGLAYLPTADPRFRRTERLRVEVPIFADDFTSKGSLLTREGVATPIVVTCSTRLDEARNLRFAVADVTLAPLAVGEYVLQVTLERKGGKSGDVAYGFRIVP
jgi:VWFA-related protein